jgi:hypothetical protein
MIYLEISLQARLIWYLCLGRYSNRTSIFRYDFTPSGLCRDVWMVFPCMAFKILWRGKVSTAYVLHPTGSFILFSILVVCLSWFSFFPLKYFVFALFSFYPVKKAQSSCHLSLYNRVSSRVLKHTTTIAPDVPTFLHLPCSGILRQKSIYYIQHSFWFLNFYLLSIPLCILS